MDVTRFKQFSQHAEMILSKQLFFVVGFEESGADLLQQMLSAHPTILCLRDGNYMDRVARPMEHLIKPYNQAIKQLGHAHNNVHSQHQPLTDEACHAAIIFTALLSVPTSIAEHVRYFGDYSASNIQYLKSLKSLFPSAKFIHVIRDGRDVLVSHLKQMQPSEEESESSIESVAGMIAAKWQDRIARAQLFARDHAADYCEVRYEDLVMYPQEELLRVMLFLGLLPDQEEIEHCASVARTNSTGPALIDISDGHIVGFTRTTGSSDWMSSLSDECIDAFQHFAGTMLLSLGYSEK